MDGGLGGSKSLKLTKGGAKVLGTQGGGVEKDSKTGRSVW